MQKLNILANPSSSYYYFYFPYYNYYREQELRKVIIYKNLHRMEKFSLKQILKHLGVQELKKSRLIFF